MEEYAEARLFATWLAERRLATFSELGALCFSCLECLHALPLLSHELHRRLR